MQVIEFIRQQFMESGHVAYGETLSMGEHMMQAAFIAEQTGCHKELVVAAFLHDFGYLILGLPEESTESGIDGFHEDIGEQCLKGYFPPLITDCIRLHVQAKRYLCTVESHYFDQLSEASRRSLAVQGGLMNHTELCAFEAEPHYREAIQIRQYDDKGKQPYLNHPDLDYYLKLTASCLIRTEMTRSRHIEVA